MRTKCQEERQNRSRDKNQLYLESPLCPHVEGSDNEAVVDDGGEHLLLGGFDRDGGDLCDDVTTFIGIVYDGPLIIVSSLASLFR